MVVLIPKNEIEAICTCTALFLGYSSLQEHQKDVLTDLVTGNDFLLYFQLAGTFDTVIGRLATA